MKDLKKKILKKKVAIFDIDGTIFRSSLVIELVEALIEKGLFPNGADREYRKSHKQWRDRKGDYQKYIDEVVAVFMKNIKGIHYGEFADVAEEVIAIQKNKTYIYTRDLIGKLKKKKYFLLAISQSPKTILEPFCNHLGFDKVYGRIYEIGPQSRFTGKILEEQLIENKSNVVRRAIDKENLTLDNSVGVGDTEWDISFLEMVDEPICFNPNKKLFQYAKLNDWKVVVERKDVIYEIQNGSK